MAEGETPSRLPAFVKLRSSATATNTARMFRSFRSIYEFHSQALVFYTYYSKTAFGHTLELRDGKDVGRERYRTDRLPKEKWQRAPLRLDVIPGASERKDCYDLIIRKQSRT